MVLIFAHSSGWQILIALDSPGSKRVTRIIDQTPSKIVPHPSRSSALQEAGQGHNTKVQVLHNHQTKGMSNQGKNVYHFEYDKLRQ